MKRIERMDITKTLRQIRIYAHNNNLPLIPINPRDVSFLRDPASFYRYLLEASQVANSRVYLSALYLGTGQKEMTLVDTLSERLRKVPRIDAHMFLDHNRASRIDKQGSSSVTMLGSCIGQRSFKLSLINTAKINSLIGFFLSKFPKYNELMSTFHAKMMIFDDDVLMTGANLSSIYFERRQDRYMLIKNSNLLSNYLSQLLNKLSQNNNFKDAVIQHNYEFNQSLPAQTNEECNTYVIPLTQLGKQGLVDKERFIKFVSSISNGAPRLYLSSGYFNPSVVINSVDFHSVLAPSEEANGFYRGGGFLKYVPRLYSAIYKQFMESHPNCSFNLYNNPKWSFHAKGLWVEGMENIYVHMIGSSNFNHRSSERDFEIQLVLVTADKDLISKLTEERNSLWVNSTQVDANDHSNITRVFQVMSRLLKKFL